ncbi:hypothetical protein PG995_006816 [Apiospora arundinis]
MEHIDRLPSEILLSIASYLPPADTLAFSLTKKRHHNILGDSLRWRQRCLKTWRYWKAPNDKSTLVGKPPVAVSWRRLFEERRADEEIEKLVFERIVERQDYRFELMERLAIVGDNAKDFLLQFREHTPDDANDVLARRFYADAVLGLIYRREALQVWARLTRKDTTITLEDALGAYDLFVLRNDLKDIHTMLDEIAENVREFVPGGEEQPWDDLDMKARALRLVKFLRLRQLVGNPDHTRYHDTRNNFLSLALWVVPYTSLPLQSVAIYCGVARRLGISAQPSNYPRHVYAVVEEPWTSDAGDTSGLPGLEDFAPPRGENARHHQRIYLDPFNSDYEVPTEQLVEGLAAMNVPPQHIPAIMGPTSIAEVTLRTGRNLRYSAQRAWIDTDMPPPHVDIELANYATNWCDLMLFESQQGPGSSLMDSFQPLMEKMMHQFPQDIFLAEWFLQELFSRAADADESFENDDFPELKQLGKIKRSIDQPQTPKRRPGSDSGVLLKYRVGQFFMHKLYNYRAFIIGWDQTCTMPEAWIQEMNVDDLDDGRHQPFYHVICSDSGNNKRYVAQENIRLLGVESPPPPAAMIKAAGRWFKRWDSEAHAFISNLEDEYPED